METFTFRLHPTIFLMKDCLIRLISCSTPAIESEIINTERIAGEYSLTLIFVTNIKEWYLAGVDGAGNKFKGLITDLAKKYPNLAEIHEVLIRHDYDDWKKKQNDSFKGLFPIYAQIRSGLGYYCNGAELVYKSIEESWGAANNSKTPVSFSEKDADEVKRSGWFADDENKASQVTFDSARNHLYDFTGVYDKNIANYIILLLLQSRACFIWGVHAWLGSFIIKLKKGIVPTSSSDETKKYCENNKQELTLEVRHNFINESDEKKKTVAFCTYKFVIDMHDGSIKIQEIAITFLGAENSKMARDALKDILNLEVKSDKDGHVLILPKFTLERFFARSEFMVLDGIPPPIGEILKNKRLSGLFSQSREKVISKEEKQAKAPKRHSMSQQELLDENPEEENLQRRVFDIIKSDDIGDLTQQILKNNRLICEHSINRSYLVKLIIVVEEHRQQAVNINASTEKFDKMLEDLWSKAQRPRMFIALIRALMLAIIEENIGRVKCIWRCLVRYAKDVEYDIKNIQTIDIHADFVVLNGAAWKCGGSTLEAYEKAFSSANVDVQKNNCLALRKFILEKICDSSEKSSLVQIFEFLRFLVTICRDPLVEYKSLCQTLTDGIAITIAKNSEAWKQLFYSELFITYFNNYAEDKTAFEQPLLSSLINKYITAVAMHDSKSVLNIENFLEDFGHEKNKAKVMQAFEDLLNKSNISDNATSESGSELSEYKQRVFLTFATYNIKNKNYELIRAKSGAITAQDIIEMSILYLDGSDGKSSGSEDILIYFLQEPRGKQLFKNFTEIRKQIRFAAMDSYLCAVGAGDQERIKKLFKVFCYIFTLVSNNELDVMQSAIYELIIERPSYVNTLGAILVGNFEDAVLNGCVSSVELLLNIMRYLADKINDSKICNILLDAIALNKIGWRFSSELFYSSNRSAQANTLCFVHNPASLENAVTYRKQQKVKQTKLPGEESIEKTFFTVTENQNNGSATIGFLNAEASPIFVENAQPINMMQNLFLFFLAYKLHYKYETFDGALDKLKPTRTEDVIELIQLHIRQVRQMLIMLSGKEDNWLIKSKDEVFGYIFEKIVNNNVQLNEIKLQFFKKLIDAFCVGNDVEVENMSIIMSCLFAGKFDNNQESLGVVIKKMIDNKNENLGPVVLFLSEGYKTAVLFEKTEAGDRLFKMMEECLNDKSIKKLKISVDKAKEVFMLVLGQIANLRLGRIRDNMLKLLGMVAELNMDSVKEIYEEVLNKSCEVYLKLIATEHLRSAGKIISFLQTICGKAKMENADDVFKKIIQAIIDRVIELQQSKNQVTEEKTRLLDKLDDFIRGKGSEKWFEEWLKGKGLDDAHRAVINDSKTRIEEKYTKADNWAGSYKI